MQSLTRPLLKLHESAAWFVRATEHKLLSVTVSAELRSPALKLLQQLEWHADNVSPFFTLDAPLKRATPGWEARLEALTVQHETRRKAMAQEGLELPALPPTPLESNPVRSVASRLIQLLDARCPPLSGLVVLLAPTRVEDPEALNHALTWLLDLPSLKTVRWMVLLADCQLNPSLLKKLGTAALSCDCQVDGDLLAQDAARLSAQLARVPSSGSTPTPLGGAGPKGIVPPPRPGKIAADPSLIKATLEAADKPSSLVHPSQALMVAAAARAIDAVREARVKDAIAAQLEAYRFAQQAGLVVEATIMQLVLAGYQVQAGERAGALRTFREAGDNAERAGRHDLTAQALFGVGSLELQARHTSDAARAYELAAASAIKAQLPPLAIEAHRLAGQVYLEQGREALALEQWQAALRLGGEAPKEIVQATGIREVARALAALYRGWGREAEARSVERGLEVLMQSDTHPTLTSAGPAPVNEYAAGSVK